MAKQVGFYRYKAQVKNCIDGDTLDCIIKLGFDISSTIRLRLARINCSEMNAADENERVQAERAKAFCMNSVLFKDVVVETHKTDIYGRYVGEVFYLDKNTEKNLSDELLKEGLAKPYK